MKRANRTRGMALSVAALMVTAAHGQAPPPLMPTAPKPAVANAKAVRSCESGICRVTAIATHPRF